MNEVIRSLSDYRKTFGATQAEMAVAMGLPYRTYQDIESGKVAFRLIHRQALDIALLNLAASRNTANLLPDHLKQLVRSIAVQL
jgi:DNA-binding XRE family transcriptional regulator